MDMNNQESEMILTSKLKVLANRNERFAIIHEEVTNLQWDISSQIEEVKEKVAKIIEDESLVDE